MRIPIDNQFAIGADQHSWHLMKRVTRKRDDNATDEWRPIRWYTSLQDACNGYAQLRLRTCEAQSVAELLAEAENTVAALCAALHPQFKVVQP